MRIPVLKPFATALGLALLTTACASGGGGKKELAYVARDVSSLYTAAKTRLDQKRYREAAQLFDEVERQHPYSVWARRAQLMGAFSYYLARDYGRSGRPAGAG